MEPGQKPVWDLPVRPWVVLAGVAAVILAVAVIYTAATPSPRDTTQERSQVMRAAQLAGFACSELRDGTPEATVTIWLTGQASGDLLRDTLRRIEANCGELLN